MVEAREVVICDRCKKIAGELPFYPNFTAGYYRGWYKFMNPGEEDICDSCMWDDPRYIAVYGVQKKSSESAKQSITAIVFADGSNG